MLHVLRVVLQTANELCDRVALEADLIHRVEQWELFDEVLVLQDEVDLSRGCRSLQLLTVEHFLLQLLDGLNNTKTQIYTI